MIFNTLRQLYRHRQEVFVVFPSALESLDDFLEVFLERDADLLARLNKGIVDGCLRCPFHATIEEAVFPLHGHRSYRPFSHQVVNRIISIIPVGK